MCQMKIDEDENLLVGIETSDDAAVYRLSDDLALVQTLDFFTPVVDDPYVFGQIAAANSLSDVYAMGGEPKLAMNIVCFPGDLAKEQIDGILRGGHDKIRESGALLVGGHTVEDKEPKYGLSVTGFVNPINVKTNANAKVGDILVLTKPLGIGIMTTAIKAGIIDKEGYSETIKVMALLNKVAKDAMVAANANSCTDITGFGFLGHALEMAKGANVSIEFDTSKIPIIEGAREFAKMGIIPGGAYKNYEHIKDHVVVDNNIKQDLLDCLVDPQTSGGLLISVGEEDLDTLINGLNENPTGYAVVGQVIEKSVKSIYLK